MAKAGCKKETSQRCINVFSCDWHKIFRKHQAITPKLTGTNKTLIHIIFVKKLR